MAQGAASPRHVEHESMSHTHCLVPGPASGCTNNWVCTCQRLCAAQALPLRFLLPLKLHLLALCSTYSHRGLLTRGHWMHLLSTPSPTLVTA